jgi:hypothetical protein
MTRRIRFLAPALAAALFLITGTAAAQGKGAGKAKETAAEAGAPGQKKIPPGQAKKVTTDQAVVVARDVLTNNGYRVVRVERVDGAQVIWYRRGNMGNGKGQGPLEKMVVRPASSIVKLEMTGSAAELGRTIGERLGIW